MRALYPVQPTFEALLEVLVEKGIIEKDKFAARVKELLAEHYKRGEFISHEDD